jgi:hypothetical protein
VGSVVNSGDQLAAADDLDRRAGQADVVAGVLREKHFVPRFERAGVRADGDDDPRQSAGLGARGTDQPVAGLGLVVARLDDDEVVERLEGHERSLRFLDHTEKRYPGRAAS